MCNMVDAQRFPESFLDDVPDGHSSIDSRWVRGFYIATPAVEAFKLATGDSARRVACCAGRGAPQLLLVTMPLLCWHQKE